MLKSNQRLSKSSGLFVVNFEFSQQALVACKLYKAMAQEAAQDDMEADVCEEMRNNAREFENLALDLLDYCYRSDVHISLQLLTYELQNWSKHTCLGIAVAAKHSAFLAHTASQMLVADLWMGGLRTRKHTNLKVYNFSL
ncbi:transient receptor potential cation channel subfamily M member 1 [Trichonephila clavipes]|nr:transient receptor potential cation channel subfamily M member 1 [Trichonephila clavipes]